MPLSRFTGGGRQLMDVFRGMIEIHDPGRMQPVPRPARVPHAAEFFPVVLRGMVAGVGHIRQSRRGARPPAQHVLQQPRQGGRQRALPRLGYRSQIHGPQSSATTIQHAHGAHGTFLVRLLAADRQENTIRARHQHRLVSAARGRCRLQQPQHLLDLRLVQVWLQTLADARYHLAQRGHRPSHVKLSPKQVQHFLLGVRAAQPTHAFGQSGRRSAGHNPEINLQGEQATLAGFQRFVQPTLQGDFTKQRPERCWGFAVGGGRSGGSRA